MLVGEWMSRDVVRWGVNDKTQVGPKRPDQVALVDAGWPAVTSRLRPAPRTMKRPFLVGPPP